MKDLIQLAYDKGAWKNLLGIALAQADMLERMVEQYERDPEIVDAENGHGMPFTVLAGKYDWGDRNIKYVESFATLDDALTALKYVSDYPWYEIEYQGCTLTLA